MDITNEKDCFCGSRGCENFQTGYFFEEILIVFNQFISSSKYCDGLMEVETYLLTSLAKAKHWLVKNEGKVLIFFDKNDHLLLQFKAE